MYIPTQMAYWSCRLLCAAIVVGTKLPRVGPIQVYRERNGATHTYGTSCVRLIINHERPQHNDQV